MSTLINNKTIFKILIIIAILLGLICPISNAVVSPTNEFYVNDYSNLLSRETKDYIIETNKKLHSSTGAQIVVVTIDSLQGQTLEIYATQLFREFGIGDKQKNNGVLLLLARKERKFKIEVGYGLEGILTDAKTGRIQDEYIIPYLKNDNWNDGIKNGFNAILEEVTNEYNINVGGEKAVNEEDKSSAIMISWCISIAICPFLSMLYSTKSKGKSIIYLIIMLGLSYLLKTTMFDFLFSVLWHGILVYSIFKRPRGGFGRRIILWWWFKLGRRLKIWRRQKFWWWRKLRRRRQFTKFLK